MLDIIPIGGVKEIGMNMFILRCNGFNICIDAGVIFPNSQYFGIESIMPDYDDLVNKIGDINFLFVTHGHEDHIGGIPYLLKRISPVIYAAPYAKELITAKCKSSTGINPKKNLKTIKFGEPISEGPFIVEYLKVDHSIPDSGALFIRTKEMNILYASDFKLGNKETADFLDKVNTINNKYGIDVLLSDSTNAYDDTESIPDDIVFDNLNECFERAEEKIIVTLFSSNIERINQVIKLSKKHNKKLFISGNNLKLHMNIGRKLGYIEDDGGCIRPETEIKKHKSKNSVFLLTGSQAERNSAIVRLSYGYHPQIKISEKDMVIFSSSKIPGNEKTIMDAINRLSELGAIIVYPDVKDVHSSGHANSKELSRFIGLVKPKFFIPLHGEFLHLKSHVDLAIKNGISPENCFILNSGEKMSFKEGRSFKGDPIEVKKLYLDSDSNELVDKKIIKSRMLAGLHGVVSVTVLIDKKKDTVTNIEINTLGSVVNKKLQDLFGGLKKKIKELLKDQNIRKDKSSSITEIENLTKREFRKLYQDKPAVIVQVILV